MWSFMAPKNHDNSDVLLKIDTQFQQAQQIAASWIKYYPSFKIDIPLKNVEKERANLGEELKAVQVLENYIKQLEAFKGSELSWQGATSLQRILWQDPIFLKYMSNEKIVKAIFFNIGKEQNLGQGFTLCNLIVGSLAESQLSYMAMTCPNWKRRPEGKDLNLHFLVDEKLLNAAFPSKVGTDHLPALLTALMSAQKVLEKIGKNNTLPAKDEVEIENIISKASSMQLLGFIKHIVKDRDIARALSAGLAGKSTELFMMNRQCLDVMKNYPALLKLQNNDHSMVMSYPIVAHALDAKHMFAALHFLNHPNEIHIGANHPATDEQKTALLQGQKCFYDFIRGLELGFKDSEMERLMHSSLQQMMRNVLVFLRKNNEITLEQLMSPKEKKVIPNDSSVLQAECQKLVALENELKKYTEPPAEVVDLYKKHYTELKETHQDKNHEEVHKQAMNQVKELHPTLHEGHDNWLKNDESLKQNLHLKK